MVYPPGHMQNSAVHHNDIRPENVTVSFCSAPHTCLYHLVDLGAASCPALNQPSFRSTWGYTERSDLSRSTPVCNMMFGSLEAVLGSMVQPCVLPLSDMQSALYTLVYLASGSLPWAQAAQSGDREASVAGELRDYVLWVCHRLGGASLMGCNVGARGNTGHMCNPALLRFLTQSCVAPVNACSPAASHAQGGNLGGVVGSPRACCCLRRMGAGECRT
jgi:hypothetical protein